VHDDNENQDQISPDVQDQINDESNPQVDVFKKRRTSLSVKAGLAFPVRRIWRQLKKQSLMRIQIKSAVYMSSVLQYIVSEILDLSAKVTKRFKKKIVKPKYLNYAMKCDKELHQLTKNAILPEVTKTFFK